MGERGDASLLAPSSYLFVLGRVILGEKREKMERKCLSVCLNSTPLKSSEDRYILERWRKRLRIDCGAARLIFGGRPRNGNIPAAIPIFAFYDYEDEWIPKQTLPTERRDGREPPSHFLIKQKGEIKSVPQKA